MGIGPDNGSLRVSSKWGLCGLRFLRNHPGYGQVDIYLKQVHNNWWQRWDCVCQDCEILGFLGASSFEGQEKAVRSSTISDKDLAFLQALSNIGRQWGEFRKQQEFLHKMQNFRMKWQDGKKNERNAAEKRWMELWDDTEKTWRKWWAVKMLTKIKKQTLGEIIEKQKKGTVSLEYGLRKSMEKE